MYLSLKRIVNVPVKYNMSFVLSGYDLLDASYEGIVMACITAHIISSVHDVWFKHILFMEKTHMKRIGQKRS